MAKQLSFALKQCVNSKFTPLAKMVHAHALKLGNLSDVHLCTHVLNAYCRCAVMLDACQLFDEISVEDEQHLLLDVVCWNSIISGCVQNRMEEEAFCRFKHMQFYHSRYSSSGNLEDLRPDSYTLSSLLSSNYCLQRSISPGEQLHGYAIKTAILSSLSVGNALITLYARWVRLKESRLVFKSMPELNIVSWTALVSGHAQLEGQEEEALRMFVIMMREGEQQPNQFTLASIFSACARLASLSQGVPFIAVALKLGLLSDIHIQNSLVGFNSECGSMEEAEAVFNGITNPDLVSWNSLLKGYSHQGTAEKALKVFKEMSMRGAIPDTITFLSVLSACSHTGMVSVGLSLFRSMKEDYGIEPEAEHVSCIVDLLGRAGQLQHAEELIRGNQQKLGPSVWRTLLGACRLHGQEELAELAASRLLELEPCDTEAHIVLSHIYAASGRWDMVAKLRCSLKEKGMVKEPGNSWIEFGNQVHSFMAADSSHPQIDVIYNTLLLLTNHTKEQIIEVPLQEP
ncbi:pentatricopeptide repeat-containing protein At2g27610-like [Macadamia integrifolia]|uniref:pentatricopeptide repeat-containing protein At2g27610-like n=1 Tax=Macadamia integrifolia TaxID=60698 RepID=UPI001C501912|nr:pentatricopeptide repeat-containing protein At2g27610-like [Macadamia integrifolia]